MEFKRIAVALLLALGYQVSTAQSNLLNADTPDQVGVKTEAQKKYDNDEPLEYGYIDDRDLLWSKMTWETIDLDERINFPLYYPVDTNNIGSDRRSLYHTLFNAVKSGKINAYEDSYFTNKRSLKDLEASMIRVDTSDVGIEQYNAEGVVDAEYIQRREISAYDISQYHIKGLWYIDSRHGEMRYRLLGIAPVAPDVNFIDDDNPDMVELFWIWFPEARDVLHSSYAFNSENTAKPITFDHILNSRRFNGLVTKTDNVQGDRQVKDYVSDNAMMQLLESQRLKERVRNMELDMWAY